MVLYFWKIQYVLIEEQLRAPDLGEYRSFGIRAVRRSSGGDEQVAYVPDVSTDRSFAAGLVELCNRGGLSPVHLQDFVMDALG